MGSTKSCPFCGEEILKKAKKCKHCGEILDAKLAKAQRPVVSGKGEGCFLQTLDIGCVIVVIIIGIIAAIIFFAMQGS